LAAPSTARRRPQSSNVAGLTRSWHSAALGGNSIVPLFWIRTGVAVILTLSSVACANLGEYVWIDDYRDTHTTASSTGYVLAAGDVVQVKVFLQEGMSARTRIRTDGKISLPFLNDVQAEGYEPAVLAQQLQVRLKDFVNNPVVTISVEEQRQVPILVVGEVVRQGTVLLPPNSGVLEAVTAAGGLNDFAHKDRVFVVRPDMAGVRIRFGLPALLRSLGQAGAFRLRPGDHVVVE
jgi:polysaccharide export outer membrane protein